MLTLAETKPEGAPRALVLVLLFTLIVATGVFGIIRFVEGERARITLDWQTRLGIVADTRAAAVSSWIGQHYAALEKIAQNGSVQPYMQEIVAAGANARLLAQSDYLKIFLTVAADRAGFRGTISGPDVPANVTRTGSAGIALLDRDAKPLVGTRSMPPITGKLAAFLATLQPDRAALLDIYSGARGNPSMAFIVPVMTGGAGGQERIGWVLGVKEVDAELYPLLRQPGNIWRSAEGLLVCRDETQIEYLTPRLKGDKDASRLVDPDTPRLAAAFALKKGDGFGKFTDYNGDDVLVSMRQISNVPWTLLYKID